VLQHGIDLHKRTMTIASLNTRGEIVQERRLRTQRSAVTQYFKDLPGPHRAVVESTGGWYWLSDLCAREGIELTLAHAYGLKAIAAAKVKTDPLDALTLAQLLRASHNYWINFRGHPLPICPDHSVTHVPSPYLLRHPPLLQPLSP
jgi:transposase